MALDCAPSPNSSATRSTGSKPTWRWPPERSGARTPWPPARRAGGGRAGRPGCSRRGPTSPSPTRSRAAAVTSSPSGGPGGPGPGPAARPGRQIAASIAGNLAESLTSAGRWDEAVEILDECSAWTCRRWDASGRRDPRPHRRGPGRPGNGRTDAGRTAFAAAACRRRAAPALARPDRDRRPAGPGRPRGCPGRGANGPDPRRPADPRYLWPLLAAAMRACAEASAVSLPPEACDRDGYARTWSCGPGARTGPGRYTTPGRRPSPRKRPAPTARADDRPDPDS